MPFKRKPEERKKEAKKAKDKYVDSSELQNIANRLGISQHGANKEKIVFELHRLKSKSKATWNALNLTDKDFKKFGVDIPK